MATGVAVKQNSLFLLVLPEIALVLESGIQRGQGICLKHLVSFK
jgi:hypothetical protein